MAGKDSEPARPGPDPVPPPGAEAFAREMERRRRAARGLERDLISEVPLLYGSPEGWPRGRDPGIELARAHREELVRRNGGGAQPSGRRSEVRLPFERLMAILAVVLYLFHLFGRHS